MRKKLCCQYFFESFVFIVKQSQNEITNPETAKSRNFEIILNRHV